MTNNYIGIMKMYIVSHICVNSLGNIAIIKYYRELEYIMFEVWSVESDRVQI